MGKQWKQWQTFFWGGSSKITADGDCSYEIKRCLLLGRKGMTNLDSILKSRHYFAHKGSSSQSYGFSSSHVWMWELDYKESWWRRKWQPTPVFLPGESHGRRSLVGYSPWGRKESYRTERLHFHFHFQPSAEKTFSSCVCYWLFSWVLKDLWPYFFLSCLFSNCITLHTVV